VNVEEKPSAEEEEVDNEDEISIEEAFIELAEGQLTATFEVYIYIYIYVCAFVCIYLYIYKYTHVF
jgi:hypothetical protein